MVGFTGSRSTEPEKCSSCVEIASLQPSCVTLRKRFALADMNHSKTGEISILRTKRTVDHGDVLDQFRTDRFERAEITLAVALGALILLDPIEQNLKPSVDATVVHIETEAPNFKGFSATFVLTRIDSRIELLEYLIVARKQSAVEYLFIPAINAWFDRGGSDHDTLAHPCHLREGEWHFQHDAIPQFTFNTYWAKPAPFRSQAIVPCRNGVNQEASAFACFLLGYLRIRRKV